MLEMPCIIRLSVSNAYKLLIKNIKSQDRSSVLIRHTSKDQPMRNHIRNLMIEAVNEAISANGITLDIAPIHAGYIFPTIFDRPSFVSWRDIGFDEARVTLWWDYDGSNDAPNETYSTTMPCVPRRHLPGLVGLTASAWFERRNGFHIQGKGSRGLFDTFVREDIRPAIAELPDAEPLGFKASGLVY